MNKTTIFREYQNVKNSSTYRFNSYIIITSRDRVFFNDGSLIFCPRSDPPVIKYSKVYAAVATFVSLSIYTVAKRISYWKVKIDLNEWWNAGIVMDYIPEV